MTSFLNLPPENYRVDIQAELAASPAYVNFIHEAQSRLYTGEEIQQLELDNPGYNVSSARDWTEIVVEVTPRGEIIDPPSPFASRSSLQRRYILNRAGRYPNNRFISTFIPGLLPEYLTEPTGIIQYANRVMATRDIQGKPISTLKIPVIPTIPSLSTFRPPVVPQGPTISRLPPLIPLPTMSRLPSVPSSRLPLGGFAPNLQRLPRVPAIASPTLPQFEYSPRSGITLPPTIEIPRSPISPPLSPSYDIYDEYDD